MGCLTEWWVQFFWKQNFSYRIRKKSTSSVKVNSRTLLLAMNSNLRYTLQNPTLGMAQRIKCLLSKYQDPSSDLQHPCKKLGTVIHL